jgi:hypothetical protein
MTVLQINNGSVNDRSVVNVNGDLFYQSLEPSIRSLVDAVRYFQQWGNRSISANIQRVLQFNNRALMRLGAAGTTFDNRLYQTQLPIQTAQGVVSQALAILDFLPVSTFESNKEPIWNGIYEGLQYFNLATADFNGLERSFCTVRAAQAGDIQLYETIPLQRTDFNDFGGSITESRIVWSFETPAFTWSQEFLLKRLVSAELWVDRVSGEVVFKLEYRPDGDTCWRLWNEWKICSARTTAEDCEHPISYPIAPYGDGYKQNMVMPKPRVGCETFSARPSDVAYQQQFRLTVKGYCRLRGMIFKAEPDDREMYKGEICG